MIERFEVYKTMPEGTLRDYPFLLNSETFPASRVWIKDQCGEIRNCTIDLEWMTEETQGTLSLLSEGDKDDSISKKEYDKFFAQDEYKMDYKDFKNGLEIMNEWFTQGVGSFVFDW